MCLKIVVTFMLLTSREGYSNKTTTEYDMSDLLSDLSDQNAAALSSQEFDAHLKNYTDRHPPAHPYEQFQPQALRGREWSFEEYLNQVYKQDYEEDTLWYWLYRQNPMTGIVHKICNVLSGIYQRARMDMLKYFKFRDFYYNTLEYEIGYLCHIIIMKYMNMLELYEIVNYRYLSRNPRYERQRMPARFMLYLYTNMIELGKTIIQYCHMLREVEDKYDSKPVETHWDDLEDAVSKSTAQSTITVSKHNNLLGEYMQYKKAKAMANLKENKMRLKLIQMGFHATTASKHPRPARYWVPKQHGQDYGWSIESPW